MASLYPKGRYIGLEEAGKIIEGTIEGFHRSKYSELAHIIIDGRAIPFINHLLVQHYTITLATSLSRVATVTRMQLSESESCSAQMIRVCWTSYIQSTGQPMNSIEMLQREELL